MASDDLIEIAFVREAHGLRGQVVIHAYSGEEGSLTEYGPLFNQDGSKSYSVHVINAKGRDFLCTIDGMTDRNQAEALRGTKFFIPASALPEPEEDEYYVRDLIGMSVRNKEGAVLGIVKDVLDLGAHDAFDIEFIHNGHNPLPEPQRELLLFTEPYVLETDLDRRILVIDLPHGLLDPVEKPK